MVIVREGMAVLICVLVALGAWVPVAGAEEAKTPISASMILSTRSSVFWSMSSNSKSWKD